MQAGADEEIPSRHYQMMRVWKQSSSEIRPGQWRTDQGSLQLVEIEWRKKAPLIVAAHHFSSHKRDLLAMPHIESCG